MPSNISTIAFSSSPGPEKMESFAVKEPPFRAQLHGRHLKSEVTLLATEEGTRAALYSDPPVPRSRFCCVVAYPFKERTARMASSPTKIH